jgi:hypothetical protein
LDLTLCSFELLKSLGYKNKFVVELLKHRDKEFNEVHFALESEDGTNKSFLDYSRLNIVYSGKGEYVNPRKDIDSLFKIKLDDSLFSRDDTYFDFFSRANLSELNKLLSDYSLVDHKRRLKRENTEENYEAYLAKLGDEPELKLSFL